MTAAETEAVTDSIEEAMLLVGGKGTRLRSVVGDRPKPMAIVAGRPFVEWVVITLRSAGVRRITMCTGYMRTAVEAHFMSGGPWDVEIDYSWESSPLGTAGAVRKRSCAGSSLAGFLVLNGDSYCEVDFGRLAEQHHAHDAAATICLTRVDDGSRYGSVTIDEEGMIRSFQEKSTEGGPGLVNAGVYVLDRDAAESIPEGRAVSLETEFFPGSRRPGPVRPGD